MTGCLRTCASGRGLGDWWCSDCSHRPSCSLPRCSHSISPCQPLPGEPAPAADAEPAAGEPSPGNQLVLWVQPRCGALHDLHSPTRSSGGRWFLPDTTGPRPNEHGGQRGPTPVRSAGHWHNQPFPSLVPGLGTRHRANVQMPVPEDAEQGLITNGMVSEGWGWVLRFSSSVS